MSNVHELPNRQKVIDEACLWIAKMDKGLTDGEEEALKQWLFEEPAHRAELFKVAALWDKMDSLAGLSDVFPHEARHPIRAMGGLPLALAFCLLVAVALVFTSQPQQQDNTDLAGVVDPGLSQVSTTFEGSYETAVGEQSSVTLPDGSLIVMNTDSQIQVTYTTKTRRLVLNRGEAHFNVAHEPARPLSVEAGEKRFVAVGTAFNVELRGDNSVELIVTDGEVLVSQRQSPGLSQNKADPPTVDRSLSVKEGESVLLNDDGSEEVAQMDGDDLALTLSWQQGNLIFTGETLEQAIREISRYTSIEFEIKDSAVKSIKVAGLFKAGDINGLLNTLRENFQIDAQRIGSDRIILSAK